MALPTWADVLGAIPGALDAFWRLFDELALKVKEQVPEAAGKIDELIADAKADALSKLNATAAEAVLVELKDQLAHLIATHQSPAPPDIGDVA